MMRWTLAIALACVMVGTPAHNAALAQCIEDAECRTGYYCVKDENRCQACLHCEELNRESLSAEPCIRSLAECGLCLKGFVDDHMEQLGAKCIEAKDGAGMPAYVIAIIIVCVLLFAVALGGVVYILRHKDDIKIISSTQTSVQGPGLEASANAPPPAGGHNKGPVGHSVATTTHTHEYEPVRPDSPPHVPHHYQPTRSPVQPPVVEDTAPSAPPSYTAATAQYKTPHIDDELSRLLHRRETEGAQAARVFGTPNYVNTTNMTHPPSYDSSVHEPAAEEAPPFAVEDDDTVPSPWTPAADTAPGNTTMSAAFSSISAESESASVPAVPAGAAGALSRPSRSDTVSPPPKMSRLSSEDTNNNRSGGESSNGRSNAQTGINVVIVNHVLNANLLHQINDVKL